MARPRGRPSKNSNVSATTAPQKRAASPATTPRRQSKRINSTSNTPGTDKSTPKKSVYFEHDSEEPESDSESDDNEASGYEDNDDASAVSSVAPTEDESEGYESEEEEEAPRRKKRKVGGLRGKPMPTQTTTTAKGRELWKEGVKVDVEGEVIIELPKARTPGKTPYQDDTIHPNTLLFLGDLKRNNERTWLKTHDADFRQSEKDWKSFVEALTEKLAEKDETIPELPPKDLVFRIYRDVRFSSDPTPYKTHFSAAWSRTGRKGPYAAYYLQIAPGKSFVGGGLWCPEAQPLGLLRRAIDTESHELKAVLRDPDIRKQYFNGIGDDEKKAVKAFCGHNAENALKRRPKDYTEDNANIDLLRLRNFTIGRKLKDDEVLGPNGLSTILGFLGTLTPFVTYLNDIVMPD